MKKQYIQPDALLIKLASGEILTASEDEVFVDGSDFFEGAF